MKTSAASTSCRCDSGACVRRRVAGERAAQRVGLPLCDEHRRAGDAANDAVPTKRVDASVWITRTRWPALVASRVNSSAL